FALRNLLRFGADLIDAAAFFPNHNPRTRRVDVDFRLLGHALDINARNARVTQLLSQKGTKLQILVEELHVLTIGIPARSPGLVHAQAETDWMCFLSHLPYLASSKVTVM